MALDRIFAYQEISLQKQQLQKQEFTREKAAFVSKGELDSLFIAQQIYLNS